uniref:Uncharacterized protein n=1 Tax=Anguilla anguilla TaxID=7936 RepID=A0A0E9XMD8_ANGAN
MTQNGTLPLLKMHLLSSNTVIGRNYNVTNSNPTIRFPYNSQSHNYKLMMHFTYFKNFTWNNQS